MRLSVNVLSASLLLPLVMHAQTPAPTTPPATEAAPPAVARHARISGGVMATQRLFYVDPVYPAEARAERLGGTVVLRVTTGKDGSVEAATLTSGPKILGESAIDAVKQWKYKPYVVNGEPVEVETTVVINFRLP
jgi:protein TonB